MTDGLSLKMNWIEKLLWAMHMHSLAWKIHKIREEIAERRRWKKFDKLLFAQMDCCCKLTPEEFVKAVQWLLAECK